MNGIKRLVLVK